MGPVPPARPAPSVAALVAAAAVLAGCGRALDVAVPSPAPTGAAAAACARLAGALPATVAGQPRRSVAPQSPLTAAWGTAVLRCGVARPAALTPTAVLLTVGGVGWFVEGAGDAQVATCAGRAAYVEVRLPGSGPSPAAVLGELSGAVAAAVPQDPPA